MLYHSIKGILSCIFGRFLIHNNVFKINEDILYKVNVKTNK